MSEASFASLNPSLLARKGGAKPAMRRQAGNAVPNAGGDLEDLGWNDMGSEADQSDEVQLSEIARLVPDAKTSSNTNTKNKTKNAPASLASSPALQQQAEIAARIESETAKPVAKASKRKKPRKTAAKRSAPKKGRRAAFTLRLDAQRHLKLRLAATINGVSAQNFVTEALDAQLAKIDDLETLAAKIKRG